MAVILLTGDDGEEVASDETTTTTTEADEADEAETTTTTTTTTTEPEDEPDRYGDDPRLDRLWDACDDGDFAACDQLYRETPVGSEYEEFGDTCGGRNEPAGWCEDIYGDPGDVEGDPALGDYGDDAALDALWDACDAGDFAACDELYFESALGSRYEWFGDTCGDRNEPAGLCEDIYG